MPIEHCRKNGKPGYRYGKTGRCYTYTAKDADSRKKAKRKAEQQGRAIEASKKGNK